MKAIPDFIKKKDKPIICIQGLGFVGTAMMIAMFFSRKLNFLRKCQAPGMEKSRAQQKIPTTATIGWIDCIALA